MTRLWARYCGRSPKTLRCPVHLLDAQAVGRLVEALDIGQHLVPQPAVLTGTEAADRLWRWECGLREDGARAGEESDGEEGRAAHGPRPGTQLTPSSLALLKTAKPRRQPNDRKVYAWTKAARKPPMKGTSPRITAPTPPTIAMPV